MSRSRSPSIIKSLVVMLVSLCVASSMSWAQTARKANDAGSQRGTPAAPVAQAVLRIVCDGASAKAEISINGKLKGECPLDIAVPGGDVRLRAFKNFGDGRESLFEEEFRMGGGTSKRVEIELPAPRLNAEGQRKEDERMAVRRAAENEQRRVARESFSKLEQAADAGDAIAMKTVGDLYATGSGVSKNSDLATQWYRRAAASGNWQAAFKLNSQVDLGAPEHLIEAQRLLALPIQPGRSVAVQGFDQVLAFTTTDTFFDMPQGRQRLTYNASNFGGVLTAQTCTRQGRSALITARGGQAETFLGGLITLNDTTSISAFSEVKTRTTAIDHLYGQPFPLIAGNRFGIVFTTESSAANARSRTSIFCAAGGATNETTGAAMKATVDCLTRRDAVGQASTVASYVFQKWAWHEPSACFMLEGMSMISAGY